MTMKYRKSAGERTFDTLNCLLMIILILVTLYPCYYVLVASLSDPSRIYEGSGMLLWPKGFVTGAYKSVLSYTQLWVSYANTALYVVSGGFLSTLITVMTAFALTRKGLPFKNLVMMLILFTMYFSGGLIPTFIVIRNLHLVDTRWVVILLPLINTYNLIITISYFKGLPYELEEAAKIDGANDYRILFQVMVPIAKPIIAVITLYYMVSLWNSYFNEMIYLTSRSKFPLQLVLREILIQNDTASVGGAASNAGDVQSYAENLKFAVIVVSTVPILCIYPFVQKYFVKGVTIGAVKG